MCFILVIRGNKPLKILRASFIGIAEFRCNLILRILPLNFVIRYKAGRPDY